MVKNFEKLIFGVLHEKHAVQRGIWVPTQHLLWDQGKPRKTLIELAGPEGPATGQLDQGFQWFSLVPEQMLSWYPNSKPTPYVSLARTA
jgi:hypothetical protein